MAIVIPEGAAVTDGQVARWIGTEPPSGDDVQAAIRYVDYAARDVAELIADAEGELDDFQVRWRVDWYRSRRAEAERLKSIYDAMFKTGRFAGWIIRESDDR